MYTNGSTRLILCLVLNKNYYVKISTIELNDYIDFNFKMLYIKYKLWVHDSYSQK